MMNLFQSPSNLLTNTVDYPADVCWLRLPPVSIFPSSAVLLRQTLSSIKIEFDGKTVFDVQIARDSS